MAASDTLYPPVRSFHHIAAMDMHVHPFPFVSHSRLL